MAQFDIHANKGQHRSTIPFVVVIQSARFDDSRTRLVVALRPAPTAGPLADPTLTPVFSVAGKRVILDPLQIVAVPVSSLGRLVASVADDRSSGAIINAIDAVITRAYG
jgi:toxin CcdB